MKTSRIVCKPNTNERGEAVVIISSTEAVRTVKVPTGSWHLPPAPISLSFTQ